MQALPRLQARNVFLTGATGLIGGALLHRLLVHSDATVYCLMRPHPNQSGIDRLAARLDGSVPRDRIAARAVPVEGDITAPGLGIDHATREALHDHLDMVLHCAATTSFLATKQCWDTNVTGLRGLLELLKGAARPPLLVYLGSAAACGALRDRSVHEDSYPTNASAHYLEYTRTKAWAELLLAREYSTEHTVAIRPSFVLPDELSTPSIARQSIWSLVIMKECSALPLNPAAAIDVVPLSFVADSIMRIAAGPRRHRVYHVSAGSSSPAWSEVMAITEETFGLPRPIRCVTGSAWRAARSVLSQHEIINVRRVQCFFPFINQNVTFDNTRLAREFGAPSAEVLSLRRYLPSLLRHVSLDSAIEQSLTD